MVLDKNYEQISNNDWTCIREEFSKKNLNVILCSEPFLKAKFLNEVINSNSYQVIFLDFDLLYSGYIISKMVKENDMVEIYRPTKKGWIANFCEIAKKISNKKFMVVIDSLNGFYNILDEKESGRLINASLMLLASIGRESDSSILISAIVRKNECGEWILSPGGRHIINSKKSGSFYLQRINNDLTISSLNQVGIIEKNQK